MRRWTPLVPAKELNSDNYYRLFRQIDQYMQYLAGSVGNIERQTPPDQRQEPPDTPPGVTDHGLLTGLVPILNPDGSVADYNDDHTQYPLIFGRPGGQYIYGDRAAGGTSWSTRGTFNLYSTNTDSSGKAYSLISIDADAPVGTGIFLVMATSFFDPSSRGTNGATSYHTTLTDTAGNTWTKKKEITAYGGASSWKTVSIWYSLVSVALTAGTHTMGCTFTTFTGPDVEMSRLAIEAYSFNLGAGTTISIIDSTSAEQNGLGGTPAALTLTATGETLYLRGMAVQPESGAFDNTLYTETAGFTPFTANHTQSTGTGSGGDLGFSARGEFKIASSGQTSSPVLAGIEIYDIASAYLAIQVVPGATGLLDLYAAPLTLASHIQLSGETININADFMNFRAPGGTTTLGYVRGSDGSFAGTTFIGGSGTFKGIADFSLVATSDKTYNFPNTSGTVALTSDITSALTAYLKLDASNDPLTGTLDTQLIEPSSTNTYDIGTAAKAYKDLYLTSDIIPTADGVMDIGTAALGIKQEHYAYPAVGTDTLRNLGRGMLWEDTSLGDTFVGADNVFGSAGYYSQRVTKANSSVTAQTEDASNFYQGAWGAGATAIFPFIEMNYLVGAGAVGKYAFGSDGATFIRDGSVTIGKCDGTSGGGGLLLCARTASIGGGAYFHFDEANKRFNIRTMGASMAASQIAQIGFAGTNLVVCLPVTDATVDLGISLTNAWKNIFLNGYAELEAIAAPAALEGRTWNDSTQKDLAGYYDGITRYFEGILFSQTADATISNTTTETTLVGTGIGTVTLPANFFVIGRTFRITARGYYGTQLTGAATLRIKGYLGATAILDTTAKAVSANLANRYWEVDAIVTCRTTGATGTVYAQGRFTHDDALVNFDDWPMVNTGTTTIDTTASLAVALKVTWGAGVAAADTLTCTHLVIEALD